MVCPFCLHKKTDVYNSRPGKRLNQTWRRRECPNCKRQFTTYESAAPTDILTLRDGNKLEPFSHIKLLLSVLRALDHLNASDVTVEYLCGTIEQKLYHASAQHASGAINKADIVAITSAVLKNFDAVAYVKYIGRYQANMPAATLRQALRKNPSHF
jgi:transcriptional repressor NrdR